MQALEPRRRSRWVATLDTAFFVLAGVASVWLAYQTLREGIQPGWPMLLAAPPLARLVISSRPALSVVTPV